MKKELHKIIKEEGLLISLSTNSIPSLKKGLHKLIKEEGLLISLSTSSKTKYEERTSQDNQRGRPFYFFVYHFFTKCEVRTIRENKDEGLLISLSTSSKPSVKKGLHMIIKEHGLLISLSTSS
jgi:glycine cleavage system regulatory protein